MCRPMNWPPSMATWRISSFWVPERTPSTSGITSPWAERTTLMKVVSYFAWGAPVISAIQTFCWSLGWLGSGTSSLPATARRSASSWACSTPSLRPTSRTAGLVARWAACSPIGPSQRLACRTLISMSRSDALSGPQWVSTVPPPSNADTDCGEDGDRPASTTDTRIATSNEARTVQRTKRTAGSTTNNLSRLASAQGVPRSDHVELFGVDVRGIDAQLLQRQQHVGDHRGRATDEVLDLVSPGALGQHLAQQHPVDPTRAPGPVRRRPAEHLHHGEVQLIAELPQFVAEEQLVDRACAGEQQHRAAVAAERQGAQHADHRGDADPGRDQHQRPAVGPVVPGEGAVRTVDPDRVTGFEGGHRGGEVAGVADGELHRRRLPRAAGGARRVLLGCSQSLTPRPRAWPRVEGHGGRVEAVPGTPGTDHQRVHVLRLRPYLDHLVRT